MKKLTQEQLSEIVLLNDLWVSTNGECGEKADLSNHDLTGLKCSGANLKYIDFSNSILIGCDFSGANMNCAILNNAKIEDANFYGASLKCASMQNMEFDFIDLRNTYIDNADLTNNDLNPAFLPPHSENFKVDSNVCEGIVERIIGIAVESNYPKHKIIEMLNEKYGGENE